jgi:23S rRNA (pseudouridine1915-N3)-methyltransferase
MPALSFHIYSFGRQKNSPLSGAEQEYVTRLRGDAQLQITELETNHKGNTPVEERLRAEGQKLLGCLTPRDFLIVLDERAKALSSQEFSELLQKQMNNGYSSFSLAIGGADGWDDSVRKRGNYLMSLSKMTFTSQIARFILIEQLYRAIGIQKGGPYHRGN